MDTQPPGQPAPYATKSYGKRPLWQWILIYLIVGGIIYYGIYYFAYANKGDSSSNTDTTNTSRGFPY